MYSSAMRKRRGQNHLWVRLSSIPANVLSRASVSIQFSWLAYLYFIYF